MQDVSKRTRNIVIMCVIAALFLAAILWLARDPAGADDTPLYSPPAPSPIDTQAVPVALMSTRTTLATPAPISFEGQAAEVVSASRGGGPCHAFRYVDSAKQNDKYGHQAMDSQWDFQWGVGCQYRNITTVDHFWCSDGGGTWDYDGCDKNHSPTGGYQMSAQANWHYHFKILGVTFRATPHVNFTVEANGHIWGTFYYDN